MEDIAFEDAPDEYQKTVWPDPSDLALLEKEFLKMDTETAEECFASVIEVINDHSKTTPVIAPVEMEPQLVGTEIEDNYHTLLFFGVKLDEWQIKDVEVVCVYQPDEMNGKPQFQWIHPNLLEFDNVIRSNSINNVIYSEGFEDVARLNPENLIKYFSEVCAAEYELLTHRLFADNVMESYGRLVAPHMNEYYLYPYDT